MPHLQALNWNFQDQLQSVELLGSSGTAYYNYDASGQRVRKVVVKANKREARIYLGGVERYREYTTSTGATVDLERWTLQVEGIAQVDTLTVDSGTTVTTLEPAIRYQYKDHLGSAALETNELGEVISYEEYHPFGSSAYRVEKSGTNLSLKRYRFTNKERDDETGLYYFGVRYYAAWLGRWTSADPGGLVDGLNLYQYARNNPIVLVDKKGYAGEPPPEYDIAIKNAIDIYGGQGYSVKGSFSEKDGISTGSINISKNGHTINSTYADGKWSYSEHFPGDKELPGVTISGQGLPTNLYTPPEIPEISTGSFIGDLFVGEIPYVGTTIDLTNAGIAFRNGNYFSAGLYSLAAIPLVGLLAGAAMKGLKRGDDAASLGVDLGESGSTITDVNVLINIAKERNGAVGLFLDPSNGGTAFKHISMAPHLDRSYHTIAIHGTPGQFWITKEPFGYGFWKTKKDLKHYPVDDDTFFDFVKNHSGWDGVKPILLQSCFGGSNRLYNFNDMVFEGLEDITPNAQRLADALGTRVKAATHKINTWILSRPKKSLHC